MMIVMICSQQSASVVMYRVLTISAKFPTSRIVHAPPMKRVMMGIRVLTTGVMQGCANIPFITERNVATLVETVLPFWPYYSMMPAFQVLMTSVIQLDAQFLELTVAKSIALIFVSVWIVLNVIDTTPVALDGNALLITHVCQSSWKACVKITINAPTSHPIGVITTDATPANVLST